MAKPTPPRTTEYVTPDLGQAAFCVAWEAPFLTVRAEGGRALFVFDAAAEPIAQRFWMPGKDSVSARRFHAALRDLRAVARQVVGSWR